MDTIDLHTHSNASDGTLSPTALVDLAVETGLAAVALTDHDTVDGLTEFVEAGVRKGIEAIPGVEINAAHGSGTLHILGYFVPVGDSPLRNALGEMRRSRVDRARAMTKRLRDLGIPIELDDVISEAAGATIGRPHFASVLVKKGVVATMSEAFERYLGKSGPAHVSRRKFSAAECIGFIASSGGIPVLAHPGTIETPGAPDLERIVGELADRGLRGIEAHYSSHSEADTARYLEIAERLGLLVTGGSDFHGKARARFDLGRGLGNLSVPAKILEPLRAEKERLRKQGLSGP